MVLLTTWDKEVTADETIEILSDLSLAHCRLAGDEGQRVAACITSRDWRALCEWNIDYDSDRSPHQLLHLRQALALFSKLEFLDVGLDKEAEARRKFHESEVNCLRTNLLFSKWSAGEFNFLPRVESVLHEARRKIGHLLGEVPSLDKLEFMFGPGATTSVPKRNACARTKLSAVPSCSSNMLPLLPGLTAEMPGYFGLRAEKLGDVETTPVEIHHGRVSFVPKNAKTYRTIMTEPTLNALVQSGIGKVIARRLRRVGQNLKDQRRNQLLALEGSLTGALATLDLSSASDSISMELVAHLLPVDWYALMCLVRTPAVNMGEGKILHLHKFSSMGNGFTFPLESLIFWALAAACVDEVGASEKRVSVYGDDIIVGTEVVPLLRQVLHCTGFTLNAEKSFWSGPFRESCGADYYRGFDIRPCYVASKVNGAKLFTIHNFYVRNGMEEFAAIVRKYIDDGLAIYGPDGFGDGHLLGDWVPKPHKRDCGYAGYVFDTYTYKPRYHTKVMVGDAVLPSYSTYAQSSESDVDWAESTDPIDHNMAYMWSTKGRWVSYPPDCTVRLTARAASKQFFDRATRATLLQVERSRNPTLHRTRGRTEGDGEKTWVPWLVTPGVDGYHRISIYTLTPP